MAAISPMAIAPPGPTKAPEAEIATSPASAPETRPLAVTCPLSIRSTSIHPNRPAQAAKWPFRMAVAALSVAPKDHPPKIDRKSGVWGKRVSGRVELGGRRINKKKKKKYKKIRIT